MTSVKLTDADVWDDSALIRSWDEALEEYKKYHSIHARGEKVEDVLNEHELAQLKRERSAQQDGGNVGSTGAPRDVPSTMEGVNGEAAANTEADVEIEGEDGELIEQPVQSNSEGQPAEVTATAISSTINAPQTLLRTVHDEALKNLLMAWYYAGYYTGLHEGQQNAKRA